MLIVLAGARVIAAVVEHVSCELQSARGAIAVASFGVKIVGFSKCGSRLVGLAEALKCPAFAGAGLSLDQAGALCQPLLSGPRGGLLPKLEVTECLGRLRFREVDARVLILGSWQLSEALHGCRCVLGSRCGDLGIRQPQPIVEVVGKRLEQCTVKINRFVPLVV